MTRLWGCGIACPHRVLGYGHRGCWGAVWGSPGWLGDKDQHSGHRTHGGATLPLCMGTLLGRVQQGAQEGGPADSDRLSRCPLPVSRELLGQIALY